MMRATIPLLLVVACLPAALAMDARFCPGLTVDGDPGDWQSCASEERVLNMARPIGTRRVVADGMRVRLAHNDQRLFMLVQVNAPYYFNLTGLKDDGVSINNHLSHSVAIAFKAGDKSTLNDMGGCPSIDVGHECDLLPAGACNNPACEDYMMDIWHIETASPGSLPGVEYPRRNFPFVAGPGFSMIGHETQPTMEFLSSGNDHTSNSDDEFSVHSCCRTDDGSSDSAFSVYKKDDIKYRNQLKFAWSHSAVTGYTYPYGDIGEQGWYTYEFSRALYTGENTDAQFTIGEDLHYGISFFRPESRETGWDDDGHWIATPTTTAFAWDWEAATLVQRAAAVEASIPFLPDVSTAAIAWTSFAIAFISIIINIYLFCRNRRTGIVYALPGK